MKYFISFLLVLLGFSFSSLATLAKNYPGFCVWSTHLIQKLKNSPSGTYALFEHTEEKDSYIFAVSYNGSVKGIVFRHFPSDSKYDAIIKENVEDLLNKEKNALLVGNKEISVTEPLSPETIKELALLGQNEKEILSQKWRKEAVIYLNLHLDEDNYKCEIKEIIKKIRKSIEEDATYEEDDFNIFKNRLESTPYDSHTLY